MAIDLDRDELELYIWNDSKCYFEGLAHARRQKIGASRGGWGNFYAFCVARYRSDIGPARPVKGLRKEVLPELEKTFMAHLAECDEHDAQRAIEAHQGKAQ